MGFAFEQAYAKALEFCEVYAAARPKAGFMKTILLRRIGSSVQAGLNTAAALLKSSEPAALDADTNDDLFREDHATIPLAPLERSLLEDVRRNLEAVREGEGSDPKILVILHYPRLGRLENHGSIISVNISYGGMGRTRFDGGVSKGADWSICRPWKFVRLQRRGTSFRRARTAKAEGQGRRNTVVGGYGCRLRGSEPSAAWQPDERRHAIEPFPARATKGRIQRIGQLRDTIYVVNMRYAGTVEDDVYSVLSSGSAISSRCWDNCPFVRGRLGGRCPQGS